MMKRLILLITLAACAPSVPEPQTPAPPKSDTIAVYTVTASIPEVGIRHWDAMKITTVDDQYRFYDANTGKLVVLRDAKWVMLSEFKEYRTRRLNP